MDEDSHDFQYKTSHYLDAQGWETEISPYYADVVTQKPREIDIIARKRWPVADRFNRKHAKLEIRLFIECKWVPADVSTHVIFIPLDTTLASFLAKNNDLLRSYDYPPLQDINKDPPRIHHYLQSPKIAKSGSPGIAVVDHQIAGDHEIRYDRRVGSHAGRA